MQKEIRFRLLVSDDYSISGYRVVGYQKQCSQHNCSIMSLYQQDIRALHDSWVDLTRSVGAWILHEAIEMGFKVKYFWVYEGDYIKYRLHEDTDTVRTGAITIWDGMAYVVEDSYSGGIPLDDVKEVLTVVGNIHNAKKTPENGYKL